MNGLRMIFGLFSTIPMGRFEFDSRTYQRFLWAVSLVGLVLSGLVWLVSRLPVRQPLSGVLVLLSYIILTGGLHMDGFGDTLDGMLSRQSRSDSLRIMRDPHLGTFGILGLVFYLLVMASCLVMALPPAAYLFPLIGRLMAYVISYRKTAARPEGLGKVFLDGVRPIIGFIGLGVIIAGAIYFQQMTVALAAGLTGLFGLVIEGWIHRRLGGLTGDTIGFGIEISQLIYLVILALGV